MGIRKYALVSFIASAMLLAGCGDPPELEAIKQVMTHADDPASLHTSGQAFVVTGEFLAEGVAVYLGCDAAFWVKDDVVYVVNEAAKKIAPTLKQAPEHITYDAVVGACRLE